MSRKAELSLETIVVAVIVLVVLGITIYLIGKYVWGADKDLGLLSQCEQRAPGATCADPCPTGYASFPGIGGCGKDGKAANCCVPNNPASS